VGLLFSRATDINVSIISGEAEGQQESFDVDYRLLFA
jgi:hypothetical protein